MRVVKFDINQKMYEKLRKWFNVEEISPELWFSLFKLSLEYKGLDAECGTVQGKLILDDGGYEILKGVAKLKRKSIEELLRDYIEKAYIILSLFEDDKVKTNENKKKAVKEYFAQKTFKG